MKTMKVLMRSFLLSFLVLVLAPTMSFSQQKIAGRSVISGIWNGQAVKYVAGEIAVRLKTGASSTALITLLNHYHGRVEQSFDKLGWGWLSLSDTTDIMLVISTLQNNSAIQSAEPNFVIHTHVLPNDPYFNGTSPATYPYQWALQNTGQTPPTGTAGADIDATNAWNVTTGSSNIIIAILDSGIPMQNGSLSHPDLSDASRIILGPDETNSGVGDEDLWGHGTNVTGIAAAETNNGKGIAGVDWNSKVLVVKVFDNGGYGTQQNFYNGVLYAVNYIQDNPGYQLVINYSGGAQTPSSVMESAVNYANSHNVTIVASVGNNVQTNFVDWPAAYSSSYNNVIAVSATDYNDQFATLYSNAGSEVNVAAPGGLGWYIDPNNGKWLYNNQYFHGKNIYSTFPNYSFGLQYSTDATQWYGYLAGTSMAAPYVSGVAALILSINPNLTPLQIRTILEQSADKVGQYSYSNGWNQYLGYGRINAYEALKYTLENYGGTLSQSLTIPAGETWNFEPGITLKFQSGTSLIVNGTLSAVGNSSHHIIFTSTGSQNPGSWGAVVFSGSGASNSTISYTDINYGTGVRFLNGANATVQNSKIYHCTYGAYIYNSAPHILTSQVLSPQQNGIYGQASGLSPLVKDNTVTGTQPIWYGYRGIWFYSSTIPFVVHNDVSGFWDGIAFGGNVTAYFSDNNYMTPYPNNLSINNGVGLDVDNDCYIWAGADFGSYCNNSIYNNSTYDVSSTNNSDVFAQLNYWGGGNAVSHKDASSTLYTTPIRTTDPWGTMAKISAGIQNNSNKQIQNVSNAVTEDSNFSDLYTGISLEKEGKVDEAIAHYKDMISRNSYVDFALTALYSLGTKYSKNEVMAYLSNIPVSNKQYVLALKLTADNALRNNRFDEAMGIYDNIIKNYPENYQGINAMFEKLFAYINVKNDMEKAGEILSGIKKHNLKDDEWQARIQVAEELMDNSISLKKENSSNLTNEDLNISREYTLLNNYPNPFNPTTIISYSIPNDGMVTLKVYDILGRKIATLVNAEKSVGSYTVSFNGENLSSGIYLYILQINEKMVTKKMLLLK